jgi:chromosome segregation ATPase
MADEQTLAFVEELERADAAAAAVLAELEELTSEVERLGESARALEARLAALPTERAVAAEAAAEGEHGLSERRAEHEAAAATLAEAEQSGDESRTAAARREELRARDLAAVAARRLEAARAEAARIDEEERTAVEEARSLEIRAREVAATLQERPGLSEAAGTPAPDGLDAVAAWATEARAALFVATGALAREREALIRQSNELAAVVLGEPLSAQSPAAVARRIAEARDGSLEGGMGTPPP